MAEDGIPAYSDSNPTNTQAGPGDDGDEEEKREPKMRLHIEKKPTIDHLNSPVHSNTPNYFSRRNTSLDMDDYFTGPRDLQKHSKWPMILQMHGSILPKMILPITLSGLWATAITVISELVHPLGVESILLTVLGFVVALGLSFRSSTAYERYAEGRRYWAQLILASQVLGRVFWVHSKENQTVAKKVDTLRRISCMNLVVAFAVSLKYKLRYQPYTNYEDLQHLVAHLNTFAKEATAANPGASALPKKSFFKEVGEYLGLSFATSNPRKAIKKSDRPLGNLPLEILSHLGMVIDAMCADGQLPVPMHQTMAYNNLTIMSDILTGTERVLTTPLPIAYAIAISQITWVYVLLLPFQLQNSLGWITIPASIAASYIILGILLIGAEIENPFGHDVNDLPLEGYCDQIAQELDTIASLEVNRENPYGFLDSEQNLPLFPTSMASYKLWAQRPRDHIDCAIKSKPAALYEARRRGSADLKREKYLGKATADLRKSMSRKRNGSSVEQSQV